MAEESTSEKLLKDAVKSCFYNAEQFIKDAELLFDNGSYGHAFALAVLGEEELAKGLTYYAYSEGILPKDFLKEVGAMRDSHIMKLSIGLGLARAYKQFVLKETVRDISSQKVKERILQLKKNKEKGLYVDVDLEKKSNEFT